MSSTACDPNWQHATFAYYRYHPSVGAAALFCVLFFLSGVFHFIQMWKTRSWYLTPLVIGCFFEFIGFVGRAASGVQDVGCWTLGPYLIQSMFILLAPALFAASIYMILGRIILLVDGQEHSIIRPQWLTKIFVTGDIVCFLMLAGGSGILATAKNNQSMSHTGNNVIIGGLVLQLIWFAIFVVVAGVFHYRMRSIPTARSQQPEVRWQVYLQTLYVSAILIIIRNLFRVIEYVEGNDGYLLSREAFIYIFDALPMLIVVFWLHWRHPGEIGLLMRGEKAFKNGFQLINVGGRS
ncbi:RTA1 like protein domain-containing protein [Trichoderma breve]|uniref:RTA1 like protein domain-containing protein n=1 Tax=Trichoderma breve TaxID=2034170 RepID=A0A9W9BBE7_9HYPO|nr:RTA1 like protein domain-containing protein [Trichoderma breve]KAJ4859382.1 RTA1 like protein domain-containing protein [Trichoderma breve]